MSAERRDEILERLLLDEESPLDAFERSPLAGDPEARAELLELLSAAERLEGLGARERAELAVPVDGAAEERVLARFRAHLAAGAPPRRPWRAVGLVAAAAVVLALGLRFLPGGEVGPPADTPLGPGARVEILRPVGEVDDYAEIAWRGERPADGRFVVRVFDDTRSGAVPTEVAASPSLEENRWLPPEEEWTSWPDRIRLRVEVLGGVSDELLDVSPEVRARRSR